MLGQTVKYILAVVLVLSGSVLSACSDTPDGSNDASQMGCTSDYECPLGAICLRPAGSTMGSCRSGQCNQERGCESGTCDPIGLVCLNTQPANCQANSCPVNQRCDVELNICVDLMSQACETNEQCEQGFCVNGLCMSVECVAHSDCGLNQECSPSFRCVDVLDECQDGDGDGYGFGPCLGMDCDDGDPNVNSGIVENGMVNCGDGIDNDCNGQDALCFVDDMDQDGVSEADGDCDDADPTIGPRRSELPYNGRDDDCNPETSDDDVDRDGFLGRAVGGDDCDDNNPNINPMGIEIPGNGLDEDCDDVDGIPTDTDEDGDGFSQAQGDCLDTDADVYPGRNELPYNGRDDDCNPATPDDDLDEDSYIRALDCDDENALVNPASRELYYNGVDDDCDPTTVDDDADNDGYRAFETGGDDCSDISSEINPGVAETPYNGIDDDCDASTPDDDVDRDGFTLADGDCDDTRGIISPAIIENGQENCSDGIDNNCVAGDVECDPNADDIDGDGVLQPADCEPNNPEVPGISEILGNGIDDDCDPTTPDLLPQCTDDQFDELQQNLSAETATAVEDGNTSAVQYGGLVLCHHDEDWYSISVQRGDGVEFDLFFDHEQADLDLHLYREESDGSITRVDSSISVNDNETVYVRSSIAAQTRYYARVFRYVDLYVAAPYQLTVNVFERCVDDQAGPTGEHNDACLNTATNFAQCLQENAARLPPVGDRRQICDYDSDMYTFNLDSQQIVRIDTLFSNDVGDLDAILYDSNGQIVASATSTSDNEVIEQMFAAGSYYLLIKGYRDVQNDYVVVLSSGEVARTDVELACLELEDCPIFGDCCTQTRALVDYNAQGYGVLFEEIPVTAPLGTVIRRLTIKDLKLSHSYLRDLRVTAGWNGQERLVLWNTQGDVEGRDAGLDDDFLSDRDIDFDNQVFSEFAGLPANGTFFLRVEDRLPGDTGSLDVLDIEVEYLLPIE